MPARTSATISTPAGLRRELAAVRRRGAAFDRGEGNYDIVCVAAPVLDAENRAVAAISITGRWRRLHVQKFDLPVRNAALRLGHLLNQAELRAPAARQQI